MTQLIDDPDRIATDPAYVELRDNPYRHAARAKVEKLWAEFEPYADPHFRSQARIQFIPRFWEMYLNSALTRQGFEREARPTGRGPDFLFRAPGGERVWIEAVAPTPGTGADRLEYRSGFVPENHVLLRIRVAIEEKARKRNWYVRAGKIDAKDPFVIAINCASLGRPPVPLLDVSDPPWILQAVFPIGPPCVEVPIDPATLVDTLAETYSSRYALIKRSGSTVSTDVFMNTEYAGISAVVYSATDHLCIPAHHGEEFRVVHNPEATRPISRTFLSIGTQYWCQDNEIRGSTCNRDAV